MLLTTGRYGFKTYDVSDPAHPRPMDTFQPDGDPRRERLLAGRGHGHRQAPQADHRRARPAPRRRRPDQLPGHRHVGHQEPAAGLSQRLLRDLLRQPAQPAPGRPRSWTCPPATRPAASTTAATSGPAARRGATTCRRASRASGPRSPRAAAATAGRSGSPTCATPRTRARSRKPIDLWRNDGATDYSHDVNVDDQRHRLGQRPRRHPRLRHRAATTATRSRTAGAARSRGTRCSWPAAASPASTSRRRISCTTRCGRSTAPRAPRGVQKGNVLIGTEEDFTEPCDKSGRVVLSDITDSHRRQARGQLDAGEAVPDEGAGHLPSGPGHAARPSTPTWTARRTTSSSRTPRSAWPGTARACACSTCRTRATCARSATTA